MTQDVFGDFRITWDPDLPLANVVWSPAVASGLPCVGVRTDIHGRFDGVAACVRQGSLIRLERPSRACLIEARAVWWEAPIASRPETASGRPAALARPRR